MTETIKIVEQKLAACVLISLASLKQKWLKSVQVCQARSEARAGNFLSFRNIANMGLKTAWTVCLSGQILKNSPGR